jgi:hypothetical protein
MDDGSGQPRDSDRKSIRDRIKRAVAEGRISAADGDIRLRNVDAAQSTGELGLIVRDLDQLESAIAPTPSAYATPAADIAAAARGTGRKTWPVLVAVIGVVVALAGAIGVFALSPGNSGSSSSSGRELNEPVPIREDPSTSSAPTEKASPAAPAYRLSAEGIRAFVQTYRQRFGTTRAVEATFYGDYVVVQVPIPGGKRHSGWVYRQASGFTDFGGEMANFPGSTVVDLSRLDIAALMTNIGRAKRVLNVEGASQTYVTIDYRPQFDPAPNVNIYLTNKFNESGYLATTLGGKVERAYPYNAG